MAAEWIDLHPDEAHVARERAAARELRRSAWWRRVIAAGVCRYCGRRTPPRQLTMDHVVPVARGGRSVKGNVVPACPACNREKRFLTPAERIIADLERPFDIALKARRDNWIHLLAVSGGRAVVVDPGDAAPVLAALAARGLTLEAVLLTHHHGDHVAGAGELRAATACEVAGPAECAAVGLDREVEDGEVVFAAGLGFAVLATPGHTRGHVVYHAAGARAAWTGDTLFAAGCGRAAEETAATMWQSLCRLRALPPATRIRGGHDYALDNLDFALSILPDDRALTIRRRAAERLAAAGRPADGAALREERRSNIFLRADEPEVARALGLPADTPPERVFAALRKRKDDW